VEYLSQNDATITLEEIKEIKNMNISQNAILKESNKIYNNSVFNGHYKIKRLEFANLFSFGGNNIIDFSEFKGIVGIIAANHLGKSSIIDIIVYTLFDEFTRKGSTKDIININKDDFYIKMDIGIGQWTYTIIKSGYRTKVGASVRVEFYRINDVSKVMERLEEDNATKTKDRIAEYFGCYEDIIHTSFSIQHDNSCFIDSSNIKRKDELERIMRFEIVKKLYEMANHKYNKDKAVYDHIKKKISTNDIAEIKKANIKSAKLLNIINTDKDYAKDKIKLLHAAILETSNKLHTECNKFMEANTKEDTQAEHSRVERDIANIAAKVLSMGAELECLRSHSPTHKPDELELEFDISRLRDVLNEDENKNNDVMKDANKKIKVIDQSNEKLYKNRKPCNIKIPSGSTHLEYLEELQNKYQNEIAEYTSQIDTLNRSIEKLQENEQQIEANNEKILELEKRMSALPEELQAISENIEELEENYNISLEEFILDIAEIMDSNVANSSNNFKQNINAHVNNMVSYKEFQKHSQKYYLAREIQSYQTGNSINGNGNNTKSISEQLAELELDTTRLKQELKGIKQLDAQIKQLDTKNNAAQNQINLLNADISNLEVNVKLDEEINQNKLKRAKYEKRIEEMDKKQIAIKNKLRKVREYDDALLKKSRLEIDLERFDAILLKFETYQQQIEENKPILEKISKLEEELAEFEEVLDLIETQFTTEQSNVVKYTAQLEQIKSDLKEGRELERKLRILELYRAALKQMPYILLAKIQPILEKKVNDLLTITTDFTVKFDMSDSKIDIYLDRSIYKDKSRNIIVNNASGFERFMASLAIRMALLELSNLPKINFMAIDEGWSSFDTHNINNVSVILDYLTSKFDFVLTISHLIQIKEHCDIQLSLKKDDYGFSKIVY
jgi:DNA repair exonuclease SbcCD ATPase subunit